MTKNIKKQTTKWEQIFWKDIDNELLITIYKEPLKLKMKKIVSY